MRAWERTDYNTLSPVLEKHKNAFGEILEEVTADSGYCSEKNLVYLKENKISSYIKLQEHEKRKTRAYTEDIGKYYNMKTQVFEDELYYVCHDGRELHHIRTESKEQVVIHRLLRCMDVQTVVVVSTKPNVSINIMPKKMQGKTKS